ncbi:MAG: hypothetical protein C3F11_10085 [Methylocystaceae bacterium]|nr:MAG: hypothetical protein C3F11_10085 [Methylocystaceae bacterium]
MRPSLPSRRSAWVRVSLCAILSHSVTDRRNGATHSTDDEIAYDKRREKFFDEAGLRIVRATNEEVFKNIDGVCETIFVALAGRTKL